ncbi:MAG TPA: hypothetical protein VJR89_23555, partial [Polyangiales bacterium]|nr:hypothetical protein [Polyangiales bacterium]
APLSAAEVEQLLHSVFGPTDYLGRTAQAVYAASQGNPAHCLELLEHLVDRGLARYREGGWTLPGLLSEAELPHRRSAMHLARLEKLSAPARRLSEVLSVADGRLRRSDCFAVSELSETDTAGALVELVLGGVLVESELGYAFVHASVRKHAASALTAQRLTRAHLRLGKSLLVAARDPVDAMRAGLHLFRAGDRHRGEHLTAAAVRYVLDGHRDRSLSAIPLMEAAVELFGAAGCRPEVLSGPLTVLADASGFIDHRLAARYGERLIATFERVLCLPRARQLSPVLGRRAALAVAMAAAARSCKGSLLEQVRMFVHSIGILHGVATASIDLATTRRCQQALAPLAVLGPHHAAGYLYEALDGISAIATEAHAKALVGTREFVHVAEHRKPIHGLKPPMRRDSITSGIFALGVLECWRMNEEALRLAARLEAFGPLEAMNAAHLRAVYYSLRGERALAAEHREQFEARALQIGAAWQVVTLGPLDAQFTALWTHDALLGKRAAAELERLSQELPSMRHEALHARATYLVLCGRYHEVIETMHASDAPRHVIGWARGQGILARAHNRLGEHARARELCRAVLAEKCEEDLTFVVLNLHVQLELSLAEAALGELDSARERVKRLLAQHADRVGPLALGAIHETRARVALFERDYDVARLHCTAMRRAYAPAQSATLFELTDQLADQIALAEHGDRPLGRNLTALLGDAAELITRVHLLGGDQSENRWEARARRGLRIALELTGAQSGFVIAPATQGDAVYADEREPDGAVVRWARSLREPKSDHSGTQRLTKLGCSAELRVNDTCYCLFQIRAHSLESRAVLVLGFRETSSRPPDQRVLAILTGALQETLA